jgi:hypothetical protein
MGSMTSNSGSLFSPTGGSGLLSRANSQSQEGDGSGRETPKAFGEFRRLVSFATRRE